MASSSAVRAGQACVEVATDNTKLNAGLRAMGDRLKATGASVAIIGAKIAAVGGIVTGVFKLASNNAASMGSELIGLSERTGLSVEALSELKYATAEAGTNMSALESSLGRLGKTMLSAIQGNREARQAFANIGLGVEELQAMRPEQQFETIADRLSQINDPALRAAAAFEIFGNSGVELLPLLNKGAAGIDALRQKARDLGLTMSGEDAAAAKAYGDGMRGLTATISMAWAKLGQAAIPIAQTVVPAFVDLTKVLTACATAMGNFFAANRGAVLLIVKIAAGVVAAGTAIVAIGSVISGVGVILGALSGGVAALGAALGFVGTMIGAVLSPIGILVATLAGLAGYLVYATGGLQTIAAAFGTLKNDAVSAFGGISDALMSGDIAGATKILWALLKLEWARGTAWLKGLWNETIYGLASFFVQSWAGLQIAWIEITGFLGDKWRDFVDYVASTSPQLASFLNGVASAVTFGSYENTHVIKKFDPSQPVPLTPAQKRAAEVERIISGTTGVLGALQTNQQADGSTATASKELDRALLDFEESILTARLKRLSGESKKNINRSLVGGATGAALGAQAAAGAQFAGVSGPALSGVSGTFSAAVAGRLSDSSIAGKQLERLQSIDENIEAIRKKGGVQFAR